jgi:hypothetical protein
MWRWICRSPSEPQAFRPVAQLQRTEHCRVCRDEEPSRESPNLMTCAFLALYIGQQVRIKLNGLELPRAELLRLPAPAALDHRHSYRAPLSPASSSSSPPLSFELVQPRSRRPDLCCRLLLPPSSPAGKESFNSSGTACLMLLPGILHSSCARLAFGESSSYKEIYTSNLNIIFCTLSLSRKYRWVCSLFVMELAIQWWSITHPLPFPKTSRSYMILSACPGPSKT